MPEPATPAEPFDAVVLAGGAGRRLGGADKAALTVSGTSLLERVLDAVADAEQTVVVGPNRPVTRRVSWTRERPPGGGPVAGLAAGLALVSAPVVAVLAADLPFLRPAHVRELRTVLGNDGGAAGAVITDDEGRDQVLAGVWRRAALRRAMPAAPAGLAMRRLIAELPLRRVALPGRPWTDVDSFADLATARWQATEDQQGGAR
jgi:molybdopterin-guanine dinucleotide biosynthesis protein A